MIERILYHYRYGITRYEVVKETAKQYKVREVRQKGLIYDRTVKKGDLDRPLDGGMWSFDPDVISKHLDYLVDRQRLSLEQFKSRVANYKKELRK